jgi:hypothetical protein
VVTTVGDSTNRAAWTQVALFFVNGGSCSARFRFPRILPGIKRKAPRTILFGNGALLFPFEEVEF